MLTCSISIATHNRLDELQRTCAVIEALRPQADEVIVCADGCTDGTAEFIRSTYPHYRFYENNPGIGSIKTRDFIIRQATGDLLLTLDDDSYPVETDFIAHLDRLFSSRPKLAVASFPQITEEFPESLEATEFGPSKYPASYVNAASAVRRSTYLELDGWETAFEHMYDESDYSIQCLAAGLQVYHDTSATIRHHWAGSNRSEVRNHHRHARNEQWSLWKRCPFPQALPVSLYRAASQARYAASRGLSWLIREPAWWAKTLPRLPEILGNRQPVPWSVYREWIDLNRQPAMSEEEWEKRFS